jgi:DNA (cytosine-5)-methyltransferase 1
MKYFSMFTGVGGFELGFEGANDLSKTKRSQQRGSEKNSPNFKQELLAPKQFTCVGLSENNKYASELLKSKFPNIKNYGDATKINPRELPDFDILCGGFPCQAFSIAGKRRGFQDTRGTLFFEVVRIVKVKRPKIIFLENVKGLLNHEKGETFKVIIQTLSELGYDVQWMVLNSKFHGVPQNRERVFIIGSLRGTSRPEILPFGGINEKNNELQRHQEVTNTIHSRITADSNGTYIESRGQTQITHPTITEAIGRQGSSKEYMKSIELIQQARSQHSRIYGKEGISPTLAGASKLSGDCTPKIAIPVLTPDRLEKRQNGRRFKDNGEESFTLTKTDIQRVLVHNTQTRSPDRPSLKKNPSAGGSGHISKYDETYCLDSGNNQAVQLDYKIRRLTPIECEFLQSFPKDWTRRGLQSFINLETYYKVNGTTKKTDSIKILSLLQETIGEEQIKEWGLNEFITLLKNEILQPRLYEESIQMEMEGKCITTRRESQSKAIDYCNRMFSMWQERKLRYSPQRQEQIEQLFRKFTGNLQKLPYEITQKRGQLEQGEPHKSEEKQERTIYTITEMSDTQRYKMMGNAVTVNVIQAIASKLFAIGKVSEQGEKHD